MHVCLGIKGHRLRYTHAPLFKEPLRCYLVKGCTTRLGSTAGIEYTFLFQDFLELAILTNRVALHRALGGGWGNVEGIVNSGIEGLMN